MNDSERVTRGDLPHWYKPGHAHFVTYRLADSIPRSKLIQWKQEREGRIRKPIPAGSILSRNRERAHKLFYKRYDEFLDQMPNVRWLQQDTVANVIRENLYHHHGSLYELLAWCVMPNHVHILIQPFESALCAVGVDHSDAGSVSHGSVSHGSVSHLTDGHVVDAASIVDRQADPFCSDEVNDHTSVLSRIMHSLKSYTANRANETLKRAGRFWQCESYDHWVRDIDELERIVEYIRWNSVAAGLCQQPRQWRFSSAFDRYEQDGSECGLVGWLRDDWRR